MNPLLERISVNPKICFGKPCIKGHRIWVSLILDFLAAGHDIDYILENYPQLQREDILACIAYRELIGQARRLDESVKPNQVEVEKMVEVVRQIRSGAAA